MSADPLLEVADRLYGLSPGDFTAARDAEAKALAADKGIAARVKALRKPSIAAWAINLLVAEWALRRPAVRRRRPLLAQAGVVR